MLDSTNPKSWTYGCEHEFADWNAYNVPKGFGRDPEPNICNTNGIATSPSLVSYPFGGEINTPPTSSIDAQGELLERFLKQHPVACATHRAGLHVHIRVPGLSESLATLKQLQRYIGSNYKVYQLVDPLPLPEPGEFSTEAEQRGARRRQQWMRMSHWTVTPAYRVQNQLKAKTIQEFFELEVPRSKVGKPLWHAQPRAAINLRQLKQTDTIEFRHFSASTNIEEVLTAIRWCRDYLIAAINDVDALSVYKRKYNTKMFPKTEPYVHWRELRWHATSITKQSRETVEKNIALILAGEFDSISNEGMEHLDPNPLGSDCY